jgi:hypothetical protein
MNYTPVTPPKAEPAKPCLPCHSPNKLETARGAFDPKAKQQQQKK